MFFTGQDTRYEEANEGLIESLNLRVDRAFDILNPLQNSGPFADEICKWSCFCGYNRRLDIYSGVLAPYQAYSPPLPEDPGYYDPGGAAKQHSQKACWKEFQAEDWLGINDISVDDEGHEIGLYLTTANITLLKFYGLLDCNVTVGPGANGTFPAHNSSDELDFGFPGLNWTWVPDDAEYVYQNPYECFSDFDNIGYAMNNYSYANFGNASLYTTQCTDVILWEESCYNPYDDSELCNAVYPGSSF